MLKNCDKTAFRPCFWGVIGYFRVDIAFFYRKFYFLARKF